MSWPTRRKWELSDSKFPRAILPRPAGDPARRRRPRSSGVRTDRRGPGQPGARRGQSRRPGQRFLRTQWTYRHGPADGGGTGAQRGGAAPGVVAPRGHGRALHPGRGRRGGAEGAELTYTTPTRCKHPVRLQLRACQEFPLMIFLPHGPLQRRRLQG